jgi:hypothetical protein
MPIKNLGVIVKRDGGHYEFVLTINNNLTSRFQFDFFLKRVQEPKVRERRFGGGHPRAGISQSLTMDGRATNRPGG